MEVANWINAAVVLALGAVYVIAWGTLPTKPRRGKSGEEYWGESATVLFVGLVFAVLGIIYVYALFNYSVSLIGGSAIGTALMIALEAFSIGGAGMYHLCFTKRAIRTLQKQGFDVSEESPAHRKAIRSAGLVLILLTIALIVSWAYALWPLLAS